MIDFVKILRDKNHKKALYEDTDLKEYGEMTVSSLKVEAIARNYEAFEAILPLLLQEHRGKFALMRDQQVIAFFPSASAAQLTGIRDYEDGRFSVQKVEDKAIDLGFYSHAKYRRFA